MKYYRIAGLQVAMDSYGRTVDQATPYEIEPVEDVNIVIRSFAETLHQKHPLLSIDDCEYLATGSSFYIQLMKYQGMMLHSSCVVVDDRAYLFTAPCGTGKSTHTSLWLKKFGNRAFILNDDKPALRLEEGVWYAYGTPWSGKHDISRNTRVPVGGIAIVERSDDNEIIRYGGAEAIRFLLTQVVRPRGAEYTVALLELLDKLMTKVPIWKLKCNMEPDAASVSFNAMSGNMMEDKNEA